MRRWWEQPRTTVVYDVYVVGFLLLGSEAAELEVKARKERVSDVSGSNSTADRNLCTTLMGNTLFMCIVLIVKSNRPMLTLRSNEISVGSVASGVEIYTAIRVKAVMAAYNMSLMVPAGDEDNEWVRSLAVDWWH